MARRVPVRRSVGRASAVGMGVVGLLLLGSLSHGLNFATTASSGAVRQVAVASAPTLTAGFQRIPQPSGQNAGDLVDFVFLPDESGASSHNLITVGRSSGLLKYVGDGEVRDIARVADLYTAGDFGLLSISLAPDYVVSGRIAVFATYTSTTRRPNGEMVPMSRLDIYRVDRPTSPTRVDFVKTVIDGISQQDGLKPSNSHGSGTVVWAPDGTLFAGIGDGAGYNTMDPLALRALDPDDLHGKIIHIDENGQGVPGNPYYGKAPSNSNRAKMFAGGLRNPFRFSLDPTRADSLYVADVGWLSHEKVLKVESGTVGGWPCYEGVDGTGNFKTLDYRDSPQCQGYYLSNQIYKPGTVQVKEVIPAPSASLINVARPNRSAAFVGGVVYQGDSYPLEYQGAYFFADYPPDAPSKIFTLTAAGSKLLRAPEANGFASSIGGPTALRSGPGGDIYYADLNTGNIWQLKYAPGNRPPEVQVTTTTDPKNGTVCFDATGSTDPDGDAFLVTIAFGDGAIGTGPLACHTYASDPSRSAAVTVTDVIGAATTKQVVVRPFNNAPTVIPVTAPGQDQKFAVGTPIRFSIRVGDVEDGPLPLVQQVIMEHCSYSTDCHSHFEDSTTLVPDAAGLVTIESEFTDHGQNTSQIFTFTATDKAGVATTWTYRASPDLRTVSVVSPTTTSIDGLQTTSLRVAVGSNNSISVPRSNENLTFERWSNGEVSNQLSFVMGDSDLTLTASYRNAIDVLAASLGARAGTPLGAESIITGGRVRQYQATTIYWSQTTGAHEVRNGNLATYQLSGGPSVLGFPITDETATADGRGYYSRFTGGEIYWTKETGSHAVVGPILQKWVELSRENSRLGYPVSEQLDAGPGASYVAFERGYIIFGQSTGPHEVVNGIRLRYDSLGGSRGRLGLPTTDELRTADGVGAFNDFTGGSIYWSPQSGMHAIFGGIRGKWVELGAEKSRLGYPTSNELDAGSGGWYNSFQNGYLIWRADTGAHMVVNGIKARYDALGGSRGVLGFPTTDEAPTLGRVGAFNLFTGGGVYWSPATGSHAVVNGIFLTYASLGGPAGSLGFPVTDEYQVPGGWRSDFEAGSILYSTSGQVTVARR